MATSSRSVRGRMVPIDLAAIDWIQAEGDYARVHAAGKSYLVARSMTDVLVNGLAVRRRGVRA